MYLINAWKQKRPRNGNIYLPDIHLLLVFDIMQLVQYRMVVEQNRVWGGGGGGWGWWGVGVAHGVGARSVPHPR